MILRFALLVILAIGTAASAQDAASPDIVVDSVELTDAPTGRAGPFRPGSEIDVIVTLRNRGDEPVSLRRMVVRASSLLDIANPEADTLDNDGDGTVDGADETFQLRNEDGVAWRMGGDGIALEPGERLSRSLRVAIRDTALPGTSGVLSFSAGSTLATGNRSRPQRTVHVFPVPFTPPLLSLAASETTKIDIASTPMFAAAIVIPGGSLSDARISLDMPPALNGEKVERLRIGTAIDCSGGSDPVIDANRMTFHLGRCRIDAEGSARDRTVRFSLKTTVTDADPDSTAEQLADWRKLAIRMILRNGDVRLGRTVLDAALHGPFLRMEARLPSGARYRPGDLVPATFSVSNLGDAAFSEPRLGLIDRDIFRCESIVVDGVLVSAADCDGDEGVLLRPEIAPGETLDITLQARLLANALIGADTGLAAKLETSGARSRPFPVAALVPVLHAAPRIAVADLGEWREEERVKTATVGQKASLRVSGTLPPGRYRGSISLLARVIDARTGAPVAPAGLAIDDPLLSILGADGSETGTQLEMMERRDSVWSHHVLPFDLQGDAESAGEDRSFSATFDVTLADDPGIKSTRVLEIIAESAAYGDSTASGNDWIEVLIAEPDLRPKLFSLDDDRVIHPDEALSVLALVCNYGDYPAYGTDLTISLPSRFDPSSAAAKKRIVTVPLDDVRSGDVADLLSDPPTRQGARVTSEASAVKLDAGDMALAKDDCIGIELSGPLGPDRLAAASTFDVVSALGPYRGRADPEGARAYPGAKTPALRFLSPAVRFGPSTTIQLGNDRRIAHPVELDVPPWLGPFRVSLSSESSSGMGWELFERLKDGSLSPWFDGAAFSPGSTVDVVMRTAAPPQLPLGWVDTSRLRAMVLTEDGRSFASTVRLVIRSGTGSARAIETDKRVAVDRDCDGALSDEHAQDAIFEPVKDASPGDCLIVRIGFENTGLKEVERIVIRDALSSRTTLLSDSASVRIAPEPLDTMSAPDPATGMLEWEFEGLFRPGAVGEVEYRLRLNPSTRKSLR